MRFSKEPTFWDAVFEIPGGIFAWIAAAALIAEFPPAAVGVAALIFWYRSILRARYAEQRAQQEADSAARAIEARRRAEEQVRVLADTLALARAGDAEAEYRYGLAVLNGEGVRKDPSIALGWFESAAKKGHAGAAFSCGELLEAESTPVSLNAASAAFARAHEIGHANALARLHSLEARLEGAAKLEAKRTRLGMSPEEWPACCRILSKCESEPEHLLLESLITTASLKPLGEAFAGRIHVEPQAKRGQYRIDFLVDGWLAVEVDGKAYHSNDRSFERDRERDRHLLHCGLTTARYPAKEIYGDALQVARDVVLLAGKKGTLLEHRSAAETALHPDQPTRISWLDAAEADGYDGLYESSVDEHTESWLEYRHDELEEANDWVALAYHRQSLDALQLSSQDESAVPDAQSDSLRER